MACNLGGVVVVAEVAQEDVAQAVVALVCHEIGSNLVVEVSVGGTDTVFQIFGITATIEHGSIVVSLNHQIVGLRHVELGTIGDATEVGGDSETLRAIFHKESGIVGPVVRHLKGCELHSRKRKWNFLED